MLTRRQTQAITGAIRGAHVAGAVDAHILDLGVYELGNVLLRSLQWPAELVADQLDDMLTIIGPPLVMAPNLARSAAALGEEHGLSFYDASWAAAARQLSMPLVTADRRLLDSGLGETATSACRRLRLG